MAVESLVKSRSLGVFHLTLCLGQTFQVYITLNSTTIFILKYVYMKIIRKTDTLAFYLNNSFPSKYLFNALHNISSTICHIKMQWGWKLITYLAQCTLGSSDVNIFSQPCMPFGSKFWHIIT